MNSLLATTALTSCMAIVNVAGTIALKVSTEPNKQVFFAVGVIAYTIGAAFYVELLKSHNLAVLSVATMVLQMGLMTSLAVWMGDSISTVQGIALGFAVTSAAVAMIAAAF